MPRATKKIDTDGLPLAIYCRLSRKKPTRKRGGRVVPDTETVDYQERRLRGFAAEQSYPIAEHLVFKDNARSAWKGQGATRPAWLAMMAAAKRGEIAGILVYRLDRFARAGRDAEDLLDLAEDRGLIIDGVKSGKINLNTAAGRKQFRDLVNAAAYESDLISERTRDTLGEIMREGKPMGGGRCFGFEIGGEEQRPDEVAIIREMVSRVLAGEPLQKLAAELNTRIGADGKPLRTVRGSKWTGANLGRMLDGSRYGGRVEHHGKVVAMMPGEPVLDPATYAELHALFATRKRGRRPTDRFLWTGVLMCSDCMGKDGRHRTMNGATRSETRADGSRPREYRCAIQLGGCGRGISAEPLERMLDRHMIALLSDPENSRRVVAENIELSEARQSQEDELQRVSERLRILDRKFFRLEIKDDDVPEYEENRAWLATRQAELLAALDASAVAKSMGAATGEDWERMTPERKRATIRSNRVRVLIGPRRQGVGKFDPKRVMIQ